MSEGKVKIVSFIPLTLRSEIDEDTYASLTWSIRMGYPRMTTYTDNKVNGDTEFNYDNLIISPMDSAMINLVLDKLDNIILGPAGEDFSVKCYNVKYVNNVKTDKVVLQSVLCMGKDKDGVVWLSNKTDNNQGVIFKLLPNDKWHKLLGTNGKEIKSPAVLSGMYAKAYAKRLRSLMDKHLADDSTVKYTDKPDTTPTV